MAAGPQCQSRECVRRGEEGPAYAEKLHMSLSGDAPYGLVVLFLV